MINKDRGLNFMMGNNDGDFFIRQNPNQMCLTYICVFKYLGILGIPHIVYLKVYYIPICGIPKGLVTILNPHTPRIIQYRHLIDFLSISKKINKII